MNEEKAFNELKKMYVDVENVFYINMFFITTVIIGVLFLFIVYNTNGNINSNIMHYSKMFLYYCGPAIMLGLYISIKSIIQPISNLSKTMLYVLSSFVLCSAFILTILLIIGCAGSISDGSVVDNSTVFITLLFIVGGYIIANIALAEKVKIIISKFSKKCILYKDFGFRHYGFKNNFYSVMDDNEFTPNHYEFKIHHKNVLKRLCNESYDIYANVVLKNFWLDYSLYLYSPDDYININLLSIKDKELRNYFITTTPHFSNDDKTNSRINKWLDVNNITLNEDTYEIPDEYKTEYKLKFL